MFTWLTYGIFEWNDMKDKGECVICLEYKKLYPFCDNHNFCKSCCKKWLSKNLGCPLCRKICNNKHFLWYNFELVNIRSVGSVRDLKSFFDRWHKQYCIRKRHKFIISIHKKKHLRTVFEKHF